MYRLASMIVPLVSAAVLTAGAANAGDYYERVGANSYKPVRNAWYSTTCCYRKVIKHVTVTKEVWVKVPPPKAPHHRPVEDDDAIERPRPAPAVHHGHQVVELGEVIQMGDGCRRAVPVRERSTTIIVMVNVSCR